MPNEEPMIPSDALCATCTHQRGNHSSGSFHCPDTPAMVGDSYRFTNSTFSLAK